MEVLMARRHRVSRTLIAILILTIALGLGFWLRSLGSDHPAQTQAEAAAPATPRASSEILAQASRPPDEPVILAAVTVTPAQPAPQPLPVVETAAAPPIAQPTTRPAPLLADRAVAQASPTPQPSGNPIATANELIAADKLTQAREVLNDALIRGDSSPEQAALIRSMLTDINQTLVFSPRRLPDDEHGGTYTVRSGDRMSKIASQYEVTWELLCRINGLSDPRKLRAGQALKVVHGPFHALVDKSEFRIELWQGTPAEHGSMFIASFPVGLGENSSTPTGTWLVETDKKIKNPTYFSPRGQGVIDADDPKNPLGEYWIGLTGIDGQAVGKESYGIHGTIEPDSIGRQMSMGCIRMHNEDVVLVFEALVEGKSSVIIRD
jgi:LysM repeat protein